VAELLAAASRGESENVRAGLFENADRELFTQAIKLAQGNQAKAARWLGVSRITMREKLIHFGLHPAQEPAAGDAPEERVGVALVQPAGSSPAQPAKSETNIPSRSIAQRRKNASNLRGK
jgi:hypothetical protein